MICVIISGDIIIYILHLYIISPCALPVNAVGCLTQTEERAQSQTDSATEDGDDEDICPPTRSTFSDFTLTLR